MHWSSASPSHPADKAEDSAHTLVPAALTQTAQSRSSAWTRLGPSTVARDPFHVGRPLTTAPAHLRLSTELLVFKWLWPLPTKERTVGRRWAGRQALLTLWTSCPPDHGPPGRHLATHTKLCPWPPRRPLPRGWTEDRPTPTGSPLGSWAEDALLPCTALQLEEGELSTRARGTSRGVKDDTAEEDRQKGHQISSWTVSLPGPAMPHSLGRSQPSLTPGSHPLGVTSPRPVAPSEAEGGCTWPCRGGTWPPWSALTEPHPGFSIAQPSSSWTEPSSLR